MVLLGDVCQVEARFILFGSTFQAHPMVLLVDVGHVEPRLGPFRDNIILKARYVHGLRQMYYRL
jgi:hypothetical protein